MDLNFHYTFDPKSNTYIQNGYKYKWNHSTQLFEYIGYLNEISYSLSAHAPAIQSAGFHLFEKSNFFRPLEVNSPISTPIRDKTSYQTDLNDNQLNSNIWAKKSTILTPKKIKRIYQTCSASKKRKEDVDYEGLDENGLIIDANARVNSRLSRKNTLLSKVGFLSSYFNNMIFIYNLKFN